MANSLQSTLNSLHTRFGAVLLPEFRGEHGIVVQAPQIKDVSLFLRNELGFDYLVDLTAVDHLGEDPRFEIVYELCNLQSNAHLRIKLRVSEENPVVPTVSDIWPTADWHEREAYDMVGVKFSGHPDLRRILMWEGYPYFPLRKDFPLAGRPSEMPDVAFTKSAPLEGGPFVTVPSSATTKDREPRSRPVE